MKLKSKKLTKFKNIAHGFLEKKEVFQVEFIDP